ncbi:MAG: ATP-binding protein [Cyanobacteriota bacterium]|nr:ATP-binding protein [Cyanobacteriota bacterium]
MHPASPSSGLSPLGLSRPGASPHPGWIVLLSPTGRVELVQPLPDTPLIGIIDSWVGRQLSELVAFDSPDALSQGLISLTRGHQPLSLPGRYPIGSHSLDMIWVIHPLFDPQGRLYRLAALGYWLNGSEIGEAQPRPPALASVRSAPGLTDSGTSWQSYSPRLTQITRNVRWTLDLDIIQQQTVEGLGELFGLDRCVVCDLPADAEPLVAAEYLGQINGAVPPVSWLHQPLPLAERGYGQAAINHPGALLVPQTGVDDPVIVSVVTRYQSQVNGLILLYSSVNRVWTEVELALITDLADQVGTAIAHARVFSESHTLARQLQQANASLLERQRESEEAHRQAEEARRQAEEASRLKSEFLANTSHELRTPLNGMIGFLKLVLDGMADDPAEQQEFIEEAHKSALHLLTLINDVLDLAKIEAGKMQIDMGPVSLRELLRDLENFARPQAEHKGLYFKILLPATRDAITVNGNYQRLLQVLLNLVSNANKFTHEGGVTISAEVKPQRVEYQDKVWPGSVKISVADTGIGVSLEKQDRLFQTFSQVDGERTRQYGGSGLGLVISQRLIENMGGTMHFISMGEGLGSTVTFTILLYQEPVMIDKDPIYPAS